MRGTKWFGVQDFFADGFLDKVFVHMIFIGLSSVNPENGVIMVFIVFAARSLGPYKVSMLCFVTLLRAMIVHTQEYPPLLTHLRTASS